MRKKEDSYGSIVTYMDIRKRKTASSTAVTQLLMEVS